jgi:inosose dehydratase
MKRHIRRISYMHFKDIDPVVKAAAIANRTGFYDACGQGIFCNLGHGRRRFPGGAADPARPRASRAGARWSRIAIRLLDPDTLGDATANRAYLKSIGF